MRFVIETTENEVCEATLLDDLGEKTQDKDAACTVTFSLDGAQHYVDIPYLTFIYTVH